jgi:hypothetical protein
MDMVMILFISASMGDYEKTVLRPLPFIVQISAQNECNTSFK